MGQVRWQKLTRERLIQFGKERAAEGAGGATIAMDISYIKTILTHAAAVHRIGASPQSVDLARVALKRLGLIGGPRARDRRPSSSELARILDCLDENPRQIIPAARIVRFAVATGMRQDEISRICWKDLDEQTRTVVVRDWKDPREKGGND